MKARCPSGKHLFRAGLFCTQLCKCQVGSSSGTGIRTPNHGEPENSRIPPWLLKQVLELTGSRGELSSNSYSVYSRAGVVVNAGTQFFIWTWKPKEPLAILFLFIHRYAKKRVGESSLGWRGVSIGRGSVVSGSGSPLFKVRLHTC